MNGNELSSSYVFDKRIIAKENKKKQKYQGIVLVVAIIISLISILLIYFQSDRSKVFGYNIVGNNLIVKNDLISYLSLKNKENFIFFNTNGLRKKILKHPLIKNAKVEKDSYNIITITIEEKEIYGYVYDNKASFITFDGERIDIDIETQKNINKVAYIYDFNDEELKIVSPYFKKINHKYINEISEIRKYKFSYDELGLMIVYRDGNYIFTTKEDLHLLENIHDIISNLKTKPSCIYLDSNTNSAYSSKCPWQIQAENIQTDVKDENSTTE